MRNMMLLLAAAALLGCVRQQAGTMTMLPNGHVGYTSQGEVIATRDPEQARAIIQGRMNQLCAGTADIKQFNFQPFGLTDARYVVTAECL